MRSAGFAVACTAARLCAARRPQSKVRLLLSTATPFSSMARISASSDSGIRPFCRAWPSMKRLVAIEIAQDRRGEAGAVDERGGLVAGGVADRLHHRLGAEIHVAVHDEGGDRLDVAVDHGLGDALLDARQRGRRGGHDHVAAQHQVGAAGGDAHGVEILGLGREADMAHHRAVLLREAREVEDGTALAFEVRRHADQRADGDDAGAADAGHQDAVGLR